MKDTVSRTSESIDNSDGILKRLMKTRRENEINVSILNSHTSPFLS